MEAVSQIIGGEHAAILLRQKSGERLELGDLLVEETSGQERIILQVFDLSYGSQMASEVLEWASGLNLEEIAAEEFMDANLRNYVLAKVKAVAHIKDGKAHAPKTLPNFFSSLRRLREDDLSFLENPAKPLYAGKVRSGSKVLEKEINLDGAEVLPTHVLIAAGTGKGKSLGGDEEVLIKDEQGARLISIEKLVDEPQKRGVEAYSVNPTSMKPSFEKITGFHRHSAPKEMFEVLTESGRKVLVTGDHSLHVLRNGKLKLLPTCQIKESDYAASTLQVDCEDKEKSVDLLELLKNERGVFCTIPDEIRNRLNRNRLREAFKTEYRAPRAAKAQLRRGIISVKILGMALMEKTTAEERRKMDLWLHGSKVKLPAEMAINQQFLRYLGYFLAEGSTHKDHAVRITNGNPKVQNDVTEFARTIGANTFIIKKGEKNTDTVIPSRLLARITTAMVGKNAGQKKMPDIAPGLPKTRLAELLRAYYEGDGSLEDEYRITATTKSEKLASGICYSLSRFGIHARIHETYKKASGSLKPKQKYYKITVTGSGQVKKFMEEIGFVYKQYPVRHPDENTNVDVIPVVGNEFRRVRLSLRIDQAELAHSAGVSRELVSMIELGKRRPSRESFKKFCWAFEKRLGQIKTANTEQLKKIRKLLDPQTKRELTEEIGKLGKTWQEIAMQMPCFDSYRPDVGANGLRRILTSIDSVNVVDAHNVVYNDLSVTRNTVQLALKDSAELLNYPNPNLPDQDTKCAYYVNSNRRNHLRAKTIRKLTGHLLQLHANALAAEPAIESMKALLNLKWEKIRSVQKKPYDKKFVYDISVEGNETFYAGRGGLFVHNSNLAKCLLYRMLDSDYAGILVLDPHNEYHSALKSHPNLEALKAYSPNPDRGAFTLKINYRSVKPWHLKGIVSLSEAQSETLWFYYKKFREDWIYRVLDDQRDEQLAGWYEKGRLKEGTLSVLQRKMELALDDKVFAKEGGETTVKDIVQALEDGKKVIVDTSHVSSDTELLIGSIIANEVFEKAKNGKGKMKSILIEEAPRVLKEGESNVFCSIAREGRKFGVGLIAITQLASLIPREILANMNTKIILGNEMRLEREALIASAAQDLTDDSKTIAGLDKGEAIISSVYTKFAVPVQFPKFEDLVESRKKPQRRFV